MKTLKIRLLVLAAIMLLPLAMNAETASEKDFRLNVMQFLREEGFVPTLDEDDNGVNFKKEGTLYWLNFTADGNVMFVEFHRAGLGLEDADLAKAAEAVNKANVDIRSAKAMMLDKSVSFAVEMYCHSAEEFRYVFYSCLGSLDRIRNYVDDYYNNGGSNSGGSGYSGNSGYSSQSETDGEIARDKFFPIYGFTIGKSVASDFRKAGYEVKAAASGATSCYLDGRGMFFDYDENGYFEKVCVLNYFHQMPPKWEALGLDWSLSYNQIVAKFTDWGFTVANLSEPKVSNTDGRKVLDAMVTATSPDGRFVATITFGSGNKNGEGYSVNSRNSIDNIQMEWK